MEKFQTRAVRCHQEAERMRELALLEGDARKRRLLFAVAEQYYLLHDQLIELQRYILLLGCDADRTAAN